MPSETLHRMDAVSEPPWMGLRRGRELCFAPAANVPPTSSATVHCPRYFGASHPI